MSMGIRLSLGGVAQVYCVHDREKRVIRNPDDCMRLMRGSINRVPNPKFQTCGCCENVFPTFSDAPQLCPGCSRPNVHKLEAPVSDPIEGVL